RAGFAQSALCGGDCQRAPLRRLRPWSFLRRLHAHCSQLRPRRFVRPFRGTGENSMSSDATDLVRRKQLVEILQQRLRGRVRDLRGEGENQGLILQGQSTTYYAKQVAQHTAMEITGLPILANKIEVY